MSKYRIKHAGKGRGGGAAVGIGSLVFLCLTALLSLTAALMIDRGGLPMTSLPIASRVIVAVSLLCGCAAASCLARRSRLLISFLSCTADLGLLLIAGAAVNETPSLRTETLLIALGSAVLAALAAGRMRRTI